MNERKTAWVALTTWVAEDVGMFYEEGGVYTKRPRCKFGDGSRPLDPSVVECPRCGQRFAGDTAE